MKAQQSALAALLLLVAAVPTHLMLYLASPGPMVYALSDTDVSHDEEHITSMDLESDYYSWDTAQIVDTEEFFSAMDEDKMKKFYEGSMAYWESIDPTDADIMGGYKDEVMPDVEFAHKFIEEHLGMMLESARQEGRRLVAMDGGAGVGRVAKHVLQYYFHELDLVEPARNLIAEAERRFNAQQVDGMSEGERQPVADTFHYHNVGLQDFDPAPARYDVIWVHGVLMFLSDPDVIRFFVSAATALKPGGLLVVRENDWQEDSNWVDSKDNSVTRSASLYRELIKKAGLRILRDQDTHQGVDTSLLPDRLYLLQP